MKDTTTQNSEMPAAIPATPISVQEQPAMNKTLLATVAIVGLIMGGLIVYVFTSKPTNVPNNLPLTTAPPTDTEQVTVTPTATTTSTPAVTIITTPKPTTTSKTYTSPFEKLSFSYPSDWKIVPSVVQSNDPAGDDLTLKSPSGNVKVVWISEMDGLGGSCGDQCPTYEVNYKQKLANSNLYYVEFIITYDNVKYYHAAALQDEASGILKTQKTMGYILFGSKTHTEVSSGLIVDSIPPYGVAETSIATTKAQAKAFFSTAEGIQAKNILLSAHY